MPEPHSTAAGIWLGAALGLTGPLLGADFDALAVGLIASILVSLAWPAIDDKRKAAAAVAFSGFASGYLAPVLSALASARVPELQAGQPLTMVFAMVIGASMPTVTPIAFRRIGALIEGGKSC